MNLKKIENLHCGACMEDFDDIKSLSEHINSCPAAISMLPIIYQVWSGGDTVGHPLSHFIQILHSNAHLIKRYAYCIADGMDSFHRSKIHAELCKKLNLDYILFRPFESSEIIEIPDRKEAEKFLWCVLYKHMKKIHNDNIH